MILVEEIMIHYYVYMVPLIEIMLAFVSRLSLKDDDGN
jgi:hypothetical protein